MNLVTFKEDIGVFEGNSDFTQEAVAMLYQLRDTDTQSDGASNIKGWQKEINHLEQFVPLRAMLINKFVEYFQQSIGDNFNMSATVIKFFANINPPGASHIMHQHIGGHYSGAYWLQAEPGAGNLIVMNPYPNTFVNTFCQPGSITYNDQGYQSYNCAEVVPKPSTGAFFNSNLVHYVDVNRSEYDRIGVAFHIYLEENKNAN